MVSCDPGSWLLVTLTCGMPAAGQRSMHFIAADLAQGQAARQPLRGRLGGKRRRRLRLQAGGTAHVGGGR